MYSNDNSPDDEMGDDASELVAHGVECVLLLTHEQTGKLVALSEKLRAIKAKHPDSMNCDKLAIVVMQSGACWVTGADDGLRSVADNAGLYGINLDTPFEPL